MPVEFLTDEQSESYGTFTAEPSLGFALQFCTVRYIGLFLSDPLAVPWPVVEYLAEQFDIADPSVVKRYTKRQMTPYEQAFGYHKSTTIRSGAGVPDVPECPKVSCRQLLVLVLPPSRYGRPS